VAALCEVSRCAAAQQHGGRRAHRRPHGHAAGTVARPQIVENVHERRVLRLSADLSTPPAAGSTVSIEVDLAVRERL
jgi:hypothetical protein